MPPAINSAKRGYPEESQSRPKPQNRHQYEDNDQYGRGPQQQDDYRNDQANIKDDSYNRQGNQHQYTLEDESYAKKPMLGQQYERVPSANEYYSLSIPDNYQPKQPSAFQRASVSNLGNFNRRHPSASIVNKAENNEFFDRNFGSQHDRKKQQQQEMKNQLVNELQIQMELKKERERREKVVKALDDQRAEDRYVKELTVLNEQRQAEAVRPPTNIFAEGLTDAEIISEKRRESEWAASKPISVQELPKDPEYSRHHQAEVSIHHKQQQELSLVSRGADRSRAIESLHAMSRDHHATQVSQNSVSNIGIGRDLDPLSSAIQQHQHPPSKYSEYNQRVADYAVERMDDRKRELRMNTNLLYQQLIDLRVIGFDSREKRTIQTTSSSRPFKTMILSEGTSKSKTGN